MEDTPWTLVQGQVPGVLSRRRQVRHRCPRGRHWRNAFRTWANPRRDVFSPAAPMTGPIRARAVHQGSCDAKASVVRFATAQAAGGAVGDGRRSRGMSTNGATWAGATAGWRAVERVNRIEGARNTRAIALGLQTPRQWHDECRPSTCSASLPVPAAASPPRAADASWPAWAGIALPMVGASTGQGWSTGTSVPSIPGEASRAMRNRGRSLRHAASIRPDTTRSRRARQPPSPGQVL